MRGFPKFFNTKQDVLNVIDEYSEQTKAFLRSCLDERMAWITIGKLAEGEAGVTDETHRVAEIKDDLTGAVTERYQEEYKEDPTCKLFRLGFTVEEVGELIG